MATSIEAQVVDGLIDRFRTVTLPAGVGVAYPNKAFTPDGTHPYIKLTVAKNQPITSHIGGGKEPIRMGIFLAVVCWPNNSGIGAASDVAQSIRNAFAYNSRWTYQAVEFRIVDEPMVQGDIVNGAYVEIPVVVKWTIYP